MSSHTRVDPATYLPHKKRGDLPSREAFHASCRERSHARLGTSYRWFKRTGPRRSLKLRDVREELGLTRKQYDRLLAAHRKLREAARG